MTKLIQQNVFYHSLENLSSSCLISRKLRLKHIKLELVWNMVFRPKGTAHCEKVHGQDAGKSIMEFHNFVAY